MNKNTSKFTKITKYLDLVNKEGYTINNINNVNFIFIWDVTLVFFFYGKGFLVLNYKKRKKIIIML